MMRVFTLLPFFWIFTIPGFAGSSSDKPGETTAEARYIYNQIGNMSMSFEAFDLAFRGWKELKDSIDLTDNVISVLDFSQPSTKKRFYLIDLQTRKVIFQDYVAHGKHGFSII